MTTAKIMVVMRSGRWRGGAEWMLWHLLDHGRVDQIEWVVVFLEDGDLARDVAALGVDTRVIPAGRMREPWRGALGLRRLGSLIRDEHIDLVLAWMADAHLYAGPVAAARRVPALWYQLWVPAPSWIDRSATLLPARGVIACSQTIADAQRRLRPRRPVRVVHPGVELARFDPARVPAPDRARVMLGLPPAGPIVGIVGRIERWKGTHVLVEAMPKVLSAHPDALAVVVGTVHDRDPEYGKFVTRRIDELGLRDSVRLVGAQRDPEVWMSAMDVVVHASQREPFGIVVIEGMALGKPVVAGNAGGPTEVITDGENGLLTAYGDADGLADAIMRYLDDPDVAARVAARGRARGADFSAELYAHRMIASITELSGLAALATPG